MTPEEKRAERLARWMSTSGIKFKSPEAKKKYKERTTRLARALQLQKPDRVPCILPAGNFAASYAGGNLHKAMYDYEFLQKAWIKFLKDFDTDAAMGAGMVPPGRVLDLTDYKLYKWPGHGIPEKALSYQAVEAERMKPDEYDRFINDPSDFWLRIFMTRIFGKLEGFKNLPAWRSFEEMSPSSFIPFGLPDVQLGFRTLIEAGDEAMKWAQAIGVVNAESQALGFPALAGGLAKAPFDTLGDTLRGTQGIMMDMFQRPAKIQEAMERIVPLAIESAVEMANATGIPMVMMPLHKGADSFMSVKQYKTFYWPTFREVVMGIVNEGIIPILFAEGSYNNRLEIIGDFPRGTVAWYFDQTDIAKAKQMIGDTCCIMGNVPTSLMLTGTPEQVKEHCRKLIEACAPGGGYILAGGANIDEGNPENLRAMMAAAQEYGIYK